MDLKPVVTPHHRPTCFGNKSLAVCLAVIRKKLTQRGLALVARRAKTGLVCRSKKVFTEWSEDSYLVWDQEVACSNHVAPTVCLKRKQRIEIGKNLTDRPSRSYRSGLGFGIYRRKPKKFHRYQVLEV